MSQVIIHTNENGNVSVCYPTGEISIQEVQVKDTPTGSIIVDESTLPTENEFFDAWELNGTTVTVNFEKAKAIKLARVNQSGLDEAYKRQLNTLAGIANEVSDADFLASLTAKRTAIADATTLEALKGVA
jgi:hypothetical protein